MANMMRHSVTKSLLPSKIDTENELHCTSDMEALQEVMPLNVEKGNELHQAWVLKEVKLYHLRNKEGITVQQT